MAKAATDKYPNLVCVPITMKATDTLTFVLVNFGSSGLFNRAGIILNRIEYEFSGPGIIDFAASGDSITLGVTSSDQITAMSSNYPQVIDLHTLFYKAVGTAADFDIIGKPVVHDYSTLPGGGLIVAAAPLYVAATSSGGSAPWSSIVRLYFEMLQLSDADYVELLQTRGLLIT